MHQLSAGSYVLYGKLAMHRVVEDVHGACAVVSLPDGVVFDESHQSLTIATLDVTANVQAVMTLREEGSVALRCASLVEPEGSLGSLFVRYSFPSFVAIRVGAVHEAG